MELELAYYDVTQSSISAIIAMETNSLLIYEHKEKLKEHKNKWKTKKIDKQIDLNESM